MPDAPKLRALDREKPRHSLLEDVFNAEWLDEQIFPELIWAIPGIIPEGFCILAGPPKVGKSWLVLNLALSVAAGKPALGSIPTVTAKPVFYLALEDGQKRLQIRMRTVHGKQRKPASLHFKVRLKPNELTTTIEQFLHENYDPENPPLVILDTLGKVMPPNKSGESAYQRDYRIGSELKEVVDNYPGSSLVAIHHDRKQESDDFVDAVSGTHGLAGSADTIIILDRKRHETEATLKVTGRDVDEREYAVTSRGEGSWELVGDNLTESSLRVEHNRVRDNLAYNSQAMITWIIEQQEVTPSQFEAKFGPETRKYLQRFVKAGRIRQINRGIYGPVESTQVIA